MANWAHHGVTATSQATSTSTTVVQAVPWARGSAEGWVVAAGDGQHSVQPPQTFDAYCRYLCTDHSWLGQPEAELAAHLLPPSSRLFTLQGTQLTHIRRAGYRKHSVRCLPQCAQDLKPQDVVLVYTNGNHWCGTCPIDWDGSWPLDAFSNEDDDERAATYKQMLTLVSEAQDKQAIRMRNLAQFAVIGPYELAKGSLVKISALDPNFSGKLDGGSMVVAVHSKVHARSYRVISEYGPLDKCFPREQMEGDMGPQNTIKDIAHASPQLQHAFAKWAQVEPRLHKVVKVGSAITQTSAFGGARRAIAAPKTLTISQMKDALRRLDPRPRLTKPANFNGTETEFLRQQCEQYLGVKTVRSDPFGTSPRRHSLSPRLPSPRSDRQQIAEAKGSCA